VGNGVPSGSRGEVATTAGEPHGHRCATPTTPRGGRRSCWATASRSGCVHSCIAPVSQPRLPPRRVCPCWTGERRQRVCDRGWCSDLLWRVSCRRCTVTRPPVPGPAALVGRTIPSPTAAAPHTARGGIAHRHDGVGLELPGSAAADPSLVPGSTCVSPVRRSLTPTRSLIADHGDRCRLAKAAQHAQRGRRSLLRCAPRCSGCRGSPTASLRPPMLRTTAVEGLLITSPPMECPTRMSQPRPADTARVCAS
jgi:hypothetical protein